MVILGIVLFFVFTLMIFARSVIIKNQASVKATEEIQNYITENSINQYVTSCLNAVADEAIVRVSMQGGQFNFSEGIENQTYIKHYYEKYNRTFNVSVVLFPNDVAKNKCVVRTAPPEYPYENSSLYSLEGFYYSNCRFLGTFIKYSGFFGFNNLTRLCNWNGSNRISTEGSIYSFQTCESGTYNNQNEASIQEELEKFIETEMSSCVNFSTIAERSTANISMDGNATATITFGKNTIFIAIQYPFTITLRNKKPIIKNIDFSVSKDIPFKEIYDYIFYAINRDVSNYKFNMLDDRANLGSLYRGYDVIKIKDILNRQDSSDELIDLIILSDNSTQIYGIPLTFQFAIKNRGPALDLIRETSGSLYDLAYVENETIILNPQGYDPDDDNITYNYSMWKEDYDDYYNISDTKCFGVSVEYAIENCTKRNYSLVPYNWSKSKLFLETQKNANYTLVKNDTGFHLVKILIKENGRQQLKDWQTIRILVFDLPVANITGNNFYDDILDNFASLEDPYFFDGSKSTVSIGSLSYFIWNDSREFYVEKKIDGIKNQTLTVPNETNNVLYNITNIRPLNFSILGQHNISLKINTTDGREDTTTIKLDVMQCLPHTNNSNLIFPYNDKPNDFWDAFYANHTCCTSEYKYAGTGVECYRDVKYGGNMSFENYATRQPTPSNHVVSYYHNSFTGKYDNDIFRREFIRNCSGTSGNICNGSAVETRTVVEPCNDNNYGTGGNERCSGPNIFTEKSTSGEVFCINYSKGQTFEFKINDLFNSNIYPAATIFCNTSLRCSKGTGSGNYDTFGNYSCKAQCDSVGSTANGKCTYAENCKCNSSCGAGGSQSCDGFDFPGNNNSMKTCNQISPSYFEDECLNCGIKKKNNVCKSGGTCTANSNCNGVSAPNLINPKNNNNNYEYCTNTCEYINCYPYKYQEGGGCYAYCTPAPNTDECASGATCKSVGMWGSFVCTDT